MGTLIKNAEIVTAEARWVGDVHCQQGRISALGTDLKSDPGDVVVDGSGQLLLPGGVDPHVHLELRVMNTVSCDDFETGTAAAVAGGTTTIIDFVHPERGEDYLDALRSRKGEASKSVCDYGLHMAVTWWGAGLRPALERCVRREGISSFKAYMAYKNTVGIDDDELLRAMECIASLDALLMVHAEHGELVEYLRDSLAAAGNTQPRFHARSRPAEAEGEAAERALFLARHTNTRLYVVHVSCAPSLQAVRASRHGGQAVHGETCPHYLLLDESLYETPGFDAARYVMSPPLRARENQALLWEALQRGDLETLATDHCPFNLVGQKDAGRHDFRKIPSGVPGIEHRLALLYTYGVRAGRLDVQKFVDLVSTRPARLFGLYPRKGAIAVGSDADLVLWDPEASSTISAQTHRHRCDHSIYEGFELRGLPSTVFLAGQIAYQNGELRVQRGQGRYLLRRGSVTL